MSYVNAPGLVTPPRPQKKAMMQNKIENAPGYALFLLTPPMFKMALGCQCSVIVLTFPPGVHKNNSKEFISATLLLLPLLLSLLFLFVYPKILPINLKSRTNSALLPTNVRRKHLRESIQEAEVGRLGNLSFRPTLMISLVNPLSAAGYTLTTKANTLKVWKESSVFIQCHYVLESV